MPATSSPAHEFDTESNSTSWKYDIHHLTSLLRLRVNPTVPYAYIAELIISHFPEYITQFYWESHLLPPRDAGWNQATNYFAQHQGHSEREVRFWLERYLEYTYTWAEKWKSLPFIEALGREAGVVAQLLDICGLSKGGFGVREEKEVRLHIKWLREGDWRLNSMSLRHEEVGEPRQWGPIGELSFGSAGEVLHSMESFAGRERRSALKEWNERERMRPVNEDLISRLEGLEGVNLWNAVASRAGWPIPSLSQAPSDQSLGSWDGLKRTIEGKRKMGALEPRTPGFELALPMHMAKSLSSTPSRLWSQQHQRRELTPSPFQGLQSNKTLDYSTQALLVESRSPLPSQIVVTLEYKPEPIDPKKVSLAVRLQSRWHGFSTQLEEIRAMENKMRGLR